MLTHDFPRTKLTETPFTFYLAAQEASLQVSAQDLSYEINETELAEELDVQKRSSSSGQATPQVGTDEFEAIYTWFIS